MTLDEYLKLNEMSVREFARLIDRPHQTVSRWVRGENDISLRDAYRVLVVTDGVVCPTDFMKEYEERSMLH